MNSGVPNGLAKRQEREKHKINIGICPLSSHSNGRNCKPTNNTLGIRLGFQGGKTEIANFNRTIGTGYEDVVALEIAMNDFFLMQKAESLQDLSAPRLKNFGVDLF